MCYYGNRLHADKPLGCNRTDGKILMGDRRMSLGTNIQYLRKLNKLTQEQFAEKMSITRQTISRWESDEVTPELNKLVEMCSIFSCKLDELVRENMSSRNEIYSEVEIRKVPAFKMARCVMISPNPEADVQNYMDIYVHTGSVTKVDAYSAVS